MTSTAKIIAALAAVAAFGTLTIAIANAATPSFGCSGKKSATERAICNSNRLASLDRRMSSEYWLLYNELPRSHRRVLRSDQRTWLGHRNACGGSASCIETEYLDRLNQLADWD